MNFRKKDNTAYLQNIKMVDAKRVYHFYILHPDEYYSYVDQSSTSTGLNDVVHFPDEYRATIKAVRAS